jgi:hypothetical protein
MNQSQAQNLIQRLKASPGAARALDAEIHLVVFGIAIVVAASGDDLPFYTASIDSALKVVPEGLYWMIGHGRDAPDEPLGGALIIDPETDEDLGEGEAATVPLSLCIAALETRLNRRLS